jgi:hypothetical protein
MIPVVLIHKGSQEYLKYAILQALKSGNEVFLIGTPDASDIVEDDNFYFFDMADYSEGFDSFQSNYVHLNTTPKDFEIFCFHRWFILKNFMNTAVLKNVFYIDSDVMLYANVNHEWEKFSQYHMTLAHRTAAVCSFMTIKGLENFVSMVEHIYSHKKGYDFNKIHSHFTVRQAHGLGGGVCDMTLFEYFHYHSEFGGGPGRVGEMMEIIDGTTYDHNINAADQDFEFENGKKNIKFLDGIPYCKSLHLDENIYFNSLHCQGGAKYLMKDIYDTFRE